MQETKDTRYPSAKTSSAGQLLAIARKNTRNTRYPSGIGIFWDPNWFSIVHMQKCVYMHTKNMLEKKALSPKDIEEIESLRGKMSPQNVRQKYGIGTTRLYKIWKNGKNDIDKDIDEDTNKQIERVSRPAKQKNIDANNKNSYKNIDPLSIALSIENMEKMLEKLSASVLDMHQRLEDTSTTTQEILAVLDANEENEPYEEVDTNKNSYKDIQELLEEKRKNLQKLLLEKNLQDLLEEDMQEFLEEEPQTRPNTTYPYMAILFLSIGVLGCLVYKKWENAKSVDPFSHPPQNTEESIMQKNTEKTNPIFIHKWKNPPPKRKPDPFYME